VLSKKKKEGRTGDAEAEKKRSSLLPWGKKRLIKDKVRKTDPLREKGRNRSEKNEEGRSVHKQEWTRSRKKKALLY